MLLGVSSQRNIKRSAQPSGLSWVVTSIIRAVSDKAAQTVLGDGFTMQLKAHGDVDKVTLICTKTDDIDLEKTFKALLDDGSTYDPPARRILTVFETT